MKVTVQECTRTLEGHKDWVTGLSFDASGSVLATGDEKGEVIIWDFPAGKPLRQWQVKGWVYGLALRDGKTVAASERVHLVFDSGRHTGLKLWDATTGKMKSDLGKSFDKVMLSAVTYVPDGKTIAVGRGGEADGMSGKVTLLDADTGKVREGLGRATSTASPTCSSRVTASTCSRRGATPS